MPLHSPLSKRDFERLADFRYRLRQFLRFSEEQAQQHGITPQAYRGSDVCDDATLGSVR